MWDSRFNLISSTSNPKLHEFYRVYFDKPPKKKQERITLGSKSKVPYPNLRDSLDNFSHRIPSKPKSKKIQEIGWNNNFHVKVSKDNLRFYKDCREYFDSPLPFDYKSTSRGSHRNPILTLTERLPKFPSTEKFYWNSLYEPISERNVVKHKSQRLYFS